MTSKDVTRDEAPSARTALVLAAVILVVVKELVPLGKYALYPFTLFATWVHEMGHGLAGLACGGTFTSLDVFADGAGLAQGSIAEGWPRGLRAMGGLLAPPALGAATLAICRGPKRARLWLWTAAVLLAVSVPLWVRSFTGVLTVPLMATALGLVAWRAGGATHVISGQLLGLLLGLDTLARLDYLFAETAHVGGRDLPSDVATVAEAFGGHYLAWGVILAGVSFALLLVGLRLAWAEPLRLWDVRALFARRARGREAEKAGVEGRAP